MKYTLIFHTQSPRRNGRREDHERILATCPTRQNAEMIRDNLAKCQYKDLLSENCGDNWGKPFYWFEIKESRR